MNTKARRSLQSMKAHVKHEKEKVERQSMIRIMNAEKPSTSTRRSNRRAIKERKMALQQDVDKLKKRLRYEVNVHKALERAFTRPLGALPRLPPYLPTDTLQLLAEVAVLEEEVIRLEEKVEHFKQGLYQEAVKKDVESCVDLSDPNLVKDLKWQHSKLSPHSEANLPSVSDEMRRNENLSSTKSSKNKQRSPNPKVQPVRTPVRKPLNECRSGERHLDPQMLQLEGRVMNFNSSEDQDRISPIDGSSPNKISEGILKCLMDIFQTMNSTKKRGINAECNDPYNLCSKFGRRDIGKYKHLVAIEAASIDPNQTTISVSLIQRLKLLVQRLATVDLKGLSHQEKLAFWINVYNLCMMNAFIEYGIPETPEMLIELMQKATVNVAGHILNAITIEHFILRLPYHSKYTFSEGTKHEEMMACRTLGLDLSEPLVTFALSCGSWSSPAVRVYTASQVENELETAKREYLQAAIGISTIEKVIAIPKLLDWYLLDFAKDFESLLDWICLQLPSQLGKEAIECIESRKDEPLSQSLEIMAYDFSFRYLFHT